MPDLRPLDFADCGCGCTPDVKPWPHTMRRGFCARAVSRDCGPQPVLVDEYGQSFGSGDVKVWDLSPELVEIYPLAKRIEHGKRHGGAVLRRRVIVVDEWEEI